MCQSDSAQWLVCIRLVTESKQPTVPCQNGNLALRPLEKIQQCILFHDGIIEEDPLFSQCRHPREIHLDQPSIWFPKKLMISPLRTSPSMKNSGLLPLSPSFVDRLIPGRSKSTEHYVSASTSGLHIAYSPPSRSAHVPSSLPVKTWEGFPQVWCTSP